jgi:hypothetical protein
VVDSAEHIVGHEDAKGARGRLGRVHPKHERGRCTERCRATAAGLPLSFETAGPGMGQ